MNIFSAFSGSKSGRTMGQRLVRLSGRTLSTIAPEHASRLAAWIWSSPPGRRRGQSTLVEGAKPISLDMDGRTAVGHLWQATGAQLSRVLVQHGWGGSVARAMRQTLSVEAQAIRDADPAIRKGVFTVQITCWLPRFVSPAPLVEPSPRRER